MHVPLVIAVLALMAFMLLPQLDRYTGAATDVHRLRSFLIRMANWINSQYKETDQ